MFKKFLLGILALAVTVALATLTVSANTQDDVPEVAENPVVVESEEHSPDSPTPTKKTSQPATDKSPAPSGGTDQPTVEPAAPQAPAPAASPQQVPIEHAPEVVYQTPVDQPDDADDLDDFDDDAYEVDDD